MPPAAYATTTKPWQARLAAAGFSDARAWFDDARVPAWRSLPDRQNATLELDGETLHVKRDARPTRRSQALEADGLLRLKHAGVPTAELVAAGRLPDGRGFVVTRDLAPRRALDALLRDGALALNDEVLAATARVAGLLHKGGLRHRDLYLNHFFVDPARPSDVVLIDAARVAPLSKLRLLARREVGKDLAAFLYSCRPFGLSDDGRARWLNQWHATSGLRPPSAWRLRAKENAIARHDARLNARQPTRHVPIPSERPA